MTAHVVFTAYDPVAPATTSVTMVSQVIRDSIGFEGLLMSDDVSMGALSGSLAERTRAALAAGCDVVLHCNGQTRGDAGGRGRGAAAGRRLRRGARKRRSARRGKPRDLDLGEARKHVCRPAGRRPAGRRTDGGVMTPDEVKFEADLATDRAATSRRWSSTSRASRDRSTCC